MGFPRCAIKLRITYNVPVWPLAALLSGRVVISLDLAARLCGLACSLYGRSRALFGERSAGISRYICAFPLTSLLLRSRFDFSDSDF